MNLRLSMGVGLRMLTIEDPSMSLSLGTEKVLYEKRKKLHFAVAIYGN